MGLGGELPPEPAGRRPAESWGLRQMGLGQRASWAQAALGAVSRDLAQRARFRGPLPATL